MAKFGTNEWADQKGKEACVRGCPHGCIYCYAHARAKRYKEPAAKDWTKFEINWERVAQRKGYDGLRCMFPVSHDISPETLGASMEMIRKMLDGGAKRLLIVSKPHIPCIKAICAAFDEYRDRILFRFSIGSDDDVILKFWEPHAPAYAERTECLRIATASGFKTSVSMEPMLDPDNAERLVEKLFVDTDFVIVGTLNNRGNLPESHKAAAGEIRSKSAAAIKRLYAKYANDPRVGWKDTAKKVLGLPGLGSEQVE